MIILTSAGGGLKVRLQMDAATEDGGNIRAYTRSKTILECVLDTPQRTIYTLSVSVNGGDAMETSYYSANDGGLVLSLKKYVQMAGDGGTIDIEVSCEIGSPAVTKKVLATVDCHEGISYNSILAPRRKDSDTFAAEFGNGVIVPPNVMLNASDYSGTWFESNLKVGANDVWSQRVGGLSAALTPYGSRGNYFKADGTADLVMFTDGNKSLSWKLSKAEPCADIVCIRWTSLTGAKRQHVFYLVGTERGNDAETSLVTAGDGYVVRKAPTIGGTIRLQGLTPYSCWYYADLLQASDAHAVFSFVGSDEWSFDEEMQSESSAVHVSGEFVQPEGNGFYSFEAKINVSHYDTD